MPARYYPLSRVRTGLRTSGNQFLLNDRPYTGPYYLTYKGEAYSGTNPATGPNELLTVRPLDEIQGARSRNRVLGGATTRESRQAAGRTQLLKQVVPFYPFPLEADYQRGYFTRYFAKKVNMNSYLIEISFDQYVDITEENDPAFEDYLAVDMFWQLKGPRNDTRVSQYEIRAGVYDTNKRVTENTAKGFRGLVEYIADDYTKFARIT
jgi:hypothetical protein